MTIALAVTVERRRARIGPLSDGEEWVRQISKDATTIGATIRTASADGRTLASNGERQSIANGSSASIASNRAPPNARIIVLTPALVPRGAVRRTLGYTVSTIFPMCWLDSIRACAAAACLSGYVESITGFTLPAATSGQTLASSALAILPLSATERGRRPEPV